MSEDFFSCVVQKEISVEEVMVKVPIFYRDALFFGGIYLAPAHKLRRLIPDARFTPAQMFPGLCPVQIQACEYHDTDLGAYNEFNVIIHLTSPHFLKIPGYNFLRQMLAKDYHVHYRMVVTDNEGSSAGLDFGWAESHASIKFLETREWMTCEVKDGDDLICRLRGHSLPTPRSDRMRFYSHQRVGPEMMTAEMRINFPRYAMSYRPGGIELALGGSHPLAVELSKLLVSTRAMGYMYSPNFQLILSAPEPS